MTDLLSSLDLALLPPDKARELAFHFISLAGEIPDYAKPAFAELLLDWNTQPAEKSWQDWLDLCAEAPASSISSFRDLVDEQYEK